MHLNCMAFENLHAICMTFKIWSHWSGPCYPMGRNEQERPQSQNGFWYPSPLSMGPLQRGKITVHIHIFSYIPLMISKQLFCGFISELLLWRAAFYMLLSGLLNATKKVLLFTIILWRHKRSNKTNKQRNSNSYSCASHCFLDYFANNKSNSSSRWHVSNFKFD